MELFKVYKARLNFGNVNKFVAEIKAKNLDELNIKLKSEFNLNPFYAVVKNSKNEVVQNEHLSFLENHH
jgi:hypothetical protein